MGVVTISREFGAVSDDFGVKVATELGYHFVDRKFIVAAAEPVRHGRIRPGVR